MPAPSKGYDMLLVNGDIPVAGGGVITGAQFTIQRMERRCATHFGECFADRYFGIPFQAWLSTRPVNLVVMQAYFRAMLDTCPGVSSVTSLTASFNNTTKQATFIANVTLSAGERVQMTVAFAEENGNPALVTLLLSPQALWA